MLVLSWNIEGIKRNSYNLHFFLEQFEPLLVFLSEPQVFSCDIDAYMTLFGGSYEYSLNSPDLYNENLPFDKNRAYGGTLAMWKSSVSPYVTVLDAPSSSILPLLLKIPGYEHSCHIGIYMPTAGLEDQFMGALSDLDSLIISIKEKYNIGNRIFIRGDMNVSSKNESRLPLLNQFMLRHNLNRVSNLHPTYHHFVGLGGEFDSDLDVILYPNEDSSHESFVAQLCKNQDPLIHSHHDILISKLSLPNLEKEPCQSPVHQAPKIENKRVKILWSEEGISAYQTILESHLDELSSRWLDVSSSSSISVLLTATNEVLHLAATTTNKFIDLSCSVNKKPTANPEVLRLRKNVLKAHKNKSQLNNDSNNLVRQRLQDELCLARSLYKKSVRNNKQQENDFRDSQLMAFASHPSTIFNKIKQSSNIKSVSIPRLRVADMTFDSKNVSDGFHMSLSMLKAPDMSNIQSTPSFQETERDFCHIMELAKVGGNIPSIKIHESIDILYSVRKDVNDLYSITASHFIYAGSAGLRHFHNLMSAFINNINHSSIQELNDIWAMILYKGHNKDKESDRSYRTISTCPLLAKCLDVYIGRRQYGKWREIQAPNQFQGEGSSHELASLLLTETIQYSLYHIRDPVFVIFLDAKSAFDVVVRQNAIVQAYKAGTTDKSLIFFNNRIGGRRTFVQWEKTLMGPIEDKRGLEQGAINSDRLYKLINNSQLREAQESQLGVDVNGVMVAAIGQADDVALISNSPHKLACMLYLTNLHCIREHVELVPEKTKLLVWSPTHKKLQTDLLKLSCKIEINNNVIDYSTSAEHVGIHRSTDAGNMPHVLDRISAHKRAMGSIMHVGLARNHQAKPSIGLQLEKLYGSSVLFSGIASLVLNEKEMKILGSHYKLTLCRLQKLPLNTPECVVYFLLGSLPVVALVHLKMLGLLGMISRLGPTSILQQIGRNILLSSTPIKKSWFSKVRDISIQYELPDPLLVLQDQKKKDIWKKECKARVISFWEEKLRGQAMYLPSLLYFQPQFMSLNRPHKIWSLPESTYEVQKSVVVATMLSGRYMTDHHTRHWSKLNPNGYCQLCQAMMHSQDTTVISNLPPLGTLEHQLLECPSLETTRVRCKTYWKDYCDDKPEVKNLSMVAGMIAGHAIDSKSCIQFLLDPSSCPDLICATQNLGIGVLAHVHYLTRTWCYSHHMRRQKLLKLLNVI